MIQFSIVYPCYQERKSLPLLIEELKRFIPRDDVEVILVENGSSDGSAEYLETIRTQYPWLKIALCANNSGYGGGIIEGLKLAQGQFVGWSHADLQCAPKDLLQAFEIITSQKHRGHVFIKGQRFGRPWVDQFFTAGMSLLESILFQKRLFDINAQPTLMNRELYEAWVDPPADFSLDLYAYVLAHQNQAQIKRFPVYFGPRKFGQSSWNTGLKSRFNFIRRTLRFSFDLKSRRR